MERQKLTEATVGLRAQSLSYEPVFYGGDHTAVRSEFGTQRRVRSPAFADVVGKEDNWKSVGVFLDRSSVRCGRDEQRCGSLRAQQSGIQISQRVNGGVAEENLGEGWMVKREERWFDRSISQVKRFFFPTILSSVSCPSINSYDCRKAPTSLTGESS